MLAESFNLGCPCGERDLQGAYSQLVIQPLFVEAFSKVENLAVDAVQFFAQLRRRLLRVLATPLLVRTRGRKFFSGRLAPTQFFGLSLQIPIPLRQSGFQVRM